MSAALFLVFTFGVGTPANSFAVGDFGWLQGEVHVIALVQLGDHNLYVLLSGTGEQKFLGLRVAREMQRGVFFQNFVNRDPDLVLVGASLRLNRKSNRRFGYGRALIKNRSAFIPKRLACSGFFQFGDRADITGMKLLHFSEEFSLND